jgi:hypothetical protein
MVGEVNGTAILDGVTFFYLVELLLMSVAVVLAFEFLVQ